jgi:hypothetical protein
MAVSALKVGRVARLLSEFDVQKIMEYEAGGYPTTPHGVPPDVWRLAVFAGRKLWFVDPKTNQSKEYVYVESISELEEQLRIAEASLAAARDPDVAISSANPNQAVWSPIGNFHERIIIRQSIIQSSQRLASRLTLIYCYISHKHYELKFSGIAEDVFIRIRQRVDSIIGPTIPEAVQRLTAVYENLRSENPEDWSNAAHSGWRILQDLADTVFPPTDEERIVQTNGGNRRIKLGQDNDINRIIAFVENASTSSRFQDLVGSHLTFLGDRLDSVFKAVRKRSHNTIVSREGADRYVVYTYLLVGDILSLRESPAGTVDS